MSVVFSVICQRLCQAGFEQHFRSPAKYLLNLAEVAVVVSDIDRLTISRKCDELVLTFAIQMNKQRGQFPQANVFPMPQVEDVPFGSALAAARSRPSTTSVTKLKSRRCFPSP